MISIFMFSSASWVSNVTSLLDAMCLAHTLPCRYNTVHVHHLNDAFSNTSIGAPPSPATVLPRCCPALTF